MLSVLRTRIQCKDLDMLTERYDWVDRWKGILILLVVVGHVAGGASHLCVGFSHDACEWVYKYIYMFHMPAFFWLAGVCWRSREIGLRAFAFQKARRLLVPYAVFGIVSIMLFLVMMQGGNLFSSTADSYYHNMGKQGWWLPFLSLVMGNGWPSGEGFRCNSVLWFLPAMFSVLCFYWVVDRLIRRKGCQLALAIALLSLEFFRRKYGAFNLPFGLSHITWYGAFVILGRCSVHVVEEACCFCHARRLAIIAAWIVFGLLVYFEPNRHVGNYSFLWYFVFCGMAVFGTVNSIVTAKEISCDWLAKIGGSSLGIMLVHKFIVIFLQVKLNIVAKTAGRSTVLFWIENIVIALLSVMISYMVTEMIRRICPWALGEKK